MPTFRHKVQAEDSTGLFESGSQQDGPMANASPSTNAGEFWPSSEAVGQSRCRRTRFQWVTE